MEYSGLGNENGIMMRHRIEAGTSCHGGFGTSLPEDLLRTGLSFDVLENFELRAVIKERMKQKRDSIRKRKREVQGARRHRSKASYCLSCTLARCRRPNSDNYTSLTQIELSFTFISQKIVTEN